MGFRTIGSMDEPVLIYHLVPGWVTAAVPDFGGAGVSSSHNSATLGRIAPQNWLGALNTYNGDGTPYCRGTCEGTVGCLCFVLFESWKRRNIVQLGS